MQRPLYYTQSKALWDEHDTVELWPNRNFNKCTCDLFTNMLNYHQDQRTYAILDGRLNDSYTTVRDNIVILNSLTHWDNYILFLLKKRNKET